jgi:hypothetical protein
MCRWAVRVTFTHTMVVMPKSSRINRAKLWGMSSPSGSRSESTSTTSLSLPPALNRRASAWRGGRLPWPRPIVMGVRYSTATGRRMLSLVFFAPVISMGLGYRPAVRPWRVFFPCALAPPRPEVSGCGISLFAKNLT